MLFLGSRPCPGVAVGDLAPNFTLPKYGTTTYVHLTDYAGRIVILDLFAYWCGPCKVASSELEPYVQQYYAGLGGNPAKIPVQLLSLSIDGSDPPATQAYINTYHLSTVLDDASRTVYNSYSVGSIPRFAVINGAANAKFNGKSVRQWEVIRLITGYTSGDYTSFRNTINNVTIVPEPSIFSLLGMGALFLIWVSRRRLKMRP
ncbi:MAG: redoxin domain-containing protein [Pirellulales bacterium]|nr:redoxin domain-containing protein [Pirellulales bacterium]